MFLESPGMIAAAVVLAHLFSEYGRVEEVGRVHFWTHYLYARLEPAVIRVADFMVRRAFFTRHPLGRALLWLTARTNILLPHGVVIPTSAAIQIVRDIEKFSAGQAHIAIGPCVCQRVLGRKREPHHKDMTVWYGAEIYKRRLGDEYTFLSADEAVSRLKEFHRRGLTPVAEFLMQSRKWMFVICSCDTEVCCPTRIYNAVRCSIFPGPFIVTQDPRRCLGVEQCGACLSRCHFGANLRRDGKAVLDPSRCLGCGLCVTTCRGQARRLSRRPGYRGRLLPWEYVKEAELQEEQPPEPPA